LIASTTTRLLVDLNRSLSSDSLFSKFTRALPANRKQKIIDEHYNPYRRSVAAAIESILGDQNTVIHLSVHTFTPRLAGVWRPFDIGLLYDPAAKPETAFCCEWQRRIPMADSRLRTRMNQPYAGTDDGLTTTFRGRFEPSQYVGIEIEINNRFFKQSPKRHQAVVAAVIQAAPTLNTVEPLQGPSRFGVGRSDRPVIDDP
jgi:predicted N-formylglutamate amidohydrolase